MYLYSLQIKGDSNKIQKIKNKEWIETLKNARTSVTSVTNEGIIERARDDEVAHRPPKK
jgi:hypothetical protein